MGIDARLKRLEQAASKIPPRRDEPTVTVTLPDEWWAAEYQGLNTVTVEYMARVEEIYGEEARERGESPLVTYLRHAATAGGAARR
jgi:hypothetical protein